MTTSRHPILRFLAWAIGSIAALVLLAVAFVQLRWDAKVGRAAPHMVAPRDSAAVARGEYIYKFGALCWGCHASGPADANAPPAGGVAFDLRTTGPGFGIWYSPNITPDSTTGIGAWSDGEIVQAIREGIRRDRTAMFPLMPIDWFSGISDDDALALVAYLRSVPPVAHKVPEQDPSFMAKALFAFGVLKPNPAITTPVASPPRGITAAYGKYVACNLALCMDCHTPRNLRDGKFFLDSLGSGSTIDFGGSAGDPLVSYARNITPDQGTGIGDWDEARFMQAVTAGIRPDGSVLDPHMPYPWFKSLTTDDLDAIYVYLKTLDPIRRPAMGTHYSAEFAAAQGIDRGRLEFIGRCQACHGQDGRGAQPTQVKLADVVSSLSDRDLNEFIRGGAVNLRMPAFGQTLHDDEIADLVSFVRSWEKRSRQSN